jgi:REP element-mobilizing transposase RayT
MKRYKLEMADWHITLRGARRLLLFHDPEDFRSFYNMLGWACEETGVAHIANCLMSNHFHLSLRGGSKELSSCMWKLDRKYSGYHNDKYGLSGHAFEQVYYRAPIPTEFILKRVVRYIHMNPVRAGLVQHPEAYGWSSYGRLMKTAPEFLGEPELRFLGMFSKDLIQARSVYAAFIDKDLKRRVVHRGAKTSASEIWQEQFRWFLEFAEESREQILPLKVEEVAAWWAVKSGIPPRAVGRVLGHGDGRQVSQMCYHLSKRLERNPELSERIRRLGVL